jgi:DNA-binding NtrC family response regulator
LSIPKVLVVDDEIHQCTALARLIESWRYETATAFDGAQALTALKTFEADVVITDLNMPVLDGKGFLEELCKQPSPPVSIVLTAFGSLEIALDAVHGLGAFWYIEKPVHATALKMILERAVEKRVLANHAGLLERELASRGALGGLVGESAAMREIFLLLQQVAPTSAVVLITGESGTGKEITARAIHQLSPRKSGPFVAVNCAAIPETLIESELFGHEKGAFTGAVERRAGCFELATGGTLLLDEIGDMPIGTQAKLLRVLEDRRVKRLGSAKEVEIDARVLASTNHDLKQAIANRTFREDLYFRLNVFEIHLPPLRERRQDIPIMAAELIRSLNAKHNCHVADVDQEVEKIFSTYAWPGNARELRNVLERAVILCGEGTITAAHLPRSCSGRPAPVTTQDQAVMTLEPGTTIAEAERSLIEMTLRHTGNNRTRAAEILGISAKTLFNKLREYSGAI